MAVPLRYVLSHGPMIATLGRVATTALRRPREIAPRPSTAGPWVNARLPPLPPELVRDYVRHVGGDPAFYRGQLPAHLFPQWGLAVGARALAPLGYPLARAMNAGCRIESRRVLPSDEPLEVRARVEAVDDDGHRAILTQRIVTGTPSAPDALIADARVFVRLHAKENGAPGARSPRPAPLVPADAREIAYLRLSASAGLDFAKLTGDFNPVHWIPAYARASGFRGCILHGFSTLARAIEALGRARFAGNPSRLCVVDVRFTSPLLLPAWVGVYVSADGRFWVGDAPEGRAFLEGQFHTNGAA
jgi:acyl dehydratase